MRTQYPLIIVLCFAVMFGMFAGSGFNAIVDGDRSTGQAQDELDSQANDSAIENGSGIAGDQSPGDEGSLVGVVISGSQTILSVLGMVALLPITLQNLGFPTWFALPIGSVAYVVAGIGFVQFVSGRVLR